MSRVGVVAKKLGMAAMFDDLGSRVPVTVLKLDDCVVVGRKEQERDGYSALQVGVSSVKNISRISKSVIGHFKKNNVAPKKKVVEFRVSDDAMVDVGTKITVNHYVVGQFVDVIGTSIGKGFAGVMKRHNFGGIRASHGASITHRSHGSTGQCQDPGKVFKGKKMAGHMGDVQVTKQNLRIESLDESEGLIFIRGSVPGAKGSYVLVKDAFKKALPGNAPYPVLKEVNVEGAGVEEAVQKEEE